MSQYASSEDIEWWLDSPAIVPGWEHMNKTWRDWMKDILATFFDEADAFDGKRPNCDSGWWSYLAVSLCIIDPQVADRDAYMKLVKLSAIGAGCDDWDQIDDLDTKVHDSLNQGRAEVAFGEVIEHLFEKRLDQAVPDGV